jgi:hypothetical protein
MANSYTSPFAHIISARIIGNPILKSAWRERLFTYMGGIARENKIKAVSIGALWNARICCGLLRPGHNCSFSFSYTLKTIGQIEQLETTPISRDTIFLLCK